MGTTGPKSACGKNLVTVKSTERIIQEHLLRTQSSDFYH